MFSAEQLFSLIKWYENESQELSLPLVVSADPAGRAKPDFIGTRPCMQTPFYYPTLPEPAFLISSPSTHATRSRSSRNSQLTPRTWVYNTFDTLLFSLKTGTSLSFSGLVCDFATTCLSQIAIFFYSPPPKKKIFCWWNNWWFLVSSCGNHKTAECPMSLSEEPTSEAPTQFVDIQ